MIAFVFLLVAIMANLLAGSGGGFAARETLSIMFRDGHLTDEAIGALIIIGVFAAVFLIILIGFLIRLAYLSYLRDLRNRL